MAKKKATGFFAVCVLNADVQAVISLLELHFIDVSGVFSRVTGESEVWTLKTHRSYDNVWELIHRHFPEMNFDVKELF